MDQPSKRAKSAKAARQASKPQSSRPQEKELGQNGKPKRRPDQLEKVKLRDKGRIPVPKTDYEVVRANGIRRDRNSDDDEEEDEDEAQSLLQILTEHLSLAFLARTRDGLSEADSREWDRWLIAYLSLLSQWLWEDPKAVRTFLEAGGMGFVRISPHIPE